jgi:hypothetical protein
VGALWSHNWRSYVLDRPYLIMAPYFNELVVLRGHGLEYL